MRVRGHVSLDVNVPTGADLVSVNPRWIQLKMEKILERRIFLFILQLLDWSRIRHSKKSITLYRGSASSSSSQYCRRIHQVW